jgi:phage gp36-like protein
MSNFIDRDDYDRKIRDYKLDQIIDQQDAILDDAELDAIQEVSDYLYQHYEVETIFQKTGDERHKSVLRWCKHIVIYNIYERIEDEMVPERVIKNYDDTIATLTKIMSGKMAVDLPRKTESEENITRFNGGSLPQRSH